MTTLAPTSLAVSMGFPAPTLKIEHTLHGIVEHFLNSRDAEGTDLLKTLPKPLRHALHKELWDMAHIEGKAIENLGSLSPSLKAAVITQFARKTLFAEDLERSALEIRDLNEWSATLPYEELSKEGRTPETAPFTHASLYPYDHTRVRLSDDTYLNASHLLGGQYILTQSPLKTTVDRFWQMIEEQNTSIIVMCNGEPGVPYHPYFPHKIRETIAFAGRSITLIKEEHLLCPELSDKERSLSDRTLLFKSSTGERRVVHHLKANHWYDFTAGDPEIVEKLIGLVRRYQKEETAPPVIHCRGGAGRAGQFALSLHLEQAAREGRPYSLPDALRECRSSETGRFPQLLQTEAQYQATARFLKNLHPAL